MRTKIAKWGNSYAIRLPKQFVEALHLREESPVYLERKGNTLTLKKSSKEEELGMLLENIRPQRETEWGAARGKELW